MRRAIRVVLIAFAYLVFLVLGGLLAVILIVRGRPADDRERAQRSLSRWAQGYMDGLRLMRLVNAPPTKIEIPAPAVVVANHPSLLDILYLFASLPPVTTVSKRSWLESRFIGPLLRATGHIAGPDREQRYSGALTLDAMLELLRGGGRLLIFPEGTRSPAGDVGRFQRGAFEAAIRCKVPIVPLLVTIDPRLLGAQQKLWDVGDRITQLRITPLDSVAPDAFPETAKRLASDVESQFRTALRG